MRLGDLLGAEVVDADGVALGRVHDVRLVQDGPVQGDFGAGLRVAGLVVGRMAMASRLGYDRFGVKAPWLVAVVARRFERDCRYVPWPDVVEVRSHVVALSSRAADLGAPVPVPLLRGPSS